MLELVKEHLRIDGKRENALLEIYINSAITYLEDAGAKEKVESKEDYSDIYKLAIMMLVSHWYELREQVSDSTPSVIPLGVQTILLQLKAGNKNG